MPDGLDDFLARADDVLENWRGSKDAATWRADGSHESGTRDLEWSEWSDQSWRLAGAIQLSSALSTIITFAGYVALRESDATGPLGMCIPVTVQVSGLCVWLHDAPGEIVFSVMHEAVCRPSLFRSSDDEWLMDLVSWSRVLLPGDMYTLSIPQDQPVLSWMFF